MGDENFQYVENEGLATLHETYQFPPKHIKDNKIHFFCEKTLLSEHQHPYIHEKNNTTPDKLFIMLKPRIRYLDNNFPLGPVIDNENNNPINLLTRVINYQLNTRYQNNYNVRLLDEPPEHKQFDGPIYQFTYVQLRHLFYLRTLHHKNPQEKYTLDITMEYKLYDNKSNNYSSSINTSVNDAINDENVFLNDMNNVNNKKYMKFTDPKLNNSYQKHKHAFWCINAFQSPKNANEYIKNAKFFEENESNGSIITKYDIIFIHNYIDQFLAFIASEEVDKEETYLLGTHILKCLLSELKPRSIITQDVLNENWADLNRSSTQIDNLVDFEDYFKKFFIYLTNREDLIADFDSFPYENRTFYIITRKLQGLIDKNSDIKLDTNNPPTYNVDNNVDNVILDVEELLNWKKQLQEFNESTLANIQNLNELKKDAEKDFSEKKNKFYTVIEENLPEHLNNILYNVSILIQNYVRNYDSQLNVIFTLVNHIIDELRNAQAAPAPAVAPGAAPVAIPLFEHNAKNTIRDLKNLTTKLYNDTENDNLKVNINETITNITSAKNALNNDKNSRLVQNILPSVINELTKITEYVTIITDEEKVDIPDDITSKTGVELLSLFENISLKIHIYIQKLKDYLRYIWLNAPFNNRRNKLPEINELSKNKIHELHYQFEIAESELIRIVQDLNTQTENINVVDTLLNIISINENEFKNKLQEVKDIYTNNVYDKCVELLSYKKEIEKSYNSYDRLRHEEYINDTLRSIDDIPNDIMTIIEILNNINNQTGRIITGLIATFQIKVMNVVNLYGNDFHNYHYINFDFDDKHRINELRIQTILKLLCWSALYKYPTLINEISKKINKLSNTDNDFLINFFSYTENWIGTLDRIGMFSINSQLLINRGVLFNRVQQDITKINRFSGNCIITHLYLLTYNRITINSPDYNKFLNLLSDVIQKVTTIRGGGTDETFNSNNNCDLAKLYAMLRANNDCNEQSLAGNIKSTTSTSSASSAPEAQSSSLSSSLDPKVSEPQKQSLLSASSDQKQSPVAGKIDTEPQDDSVGKLTSSAHNELSGLSEPDAGDGRHPQREHQAEFFADGPIVPPTHNNSSMNSSILVAQPAMVTSETDNSFPVAGPPVRTPTPEAQSPSLSSSDSKARDDKRSEPVVDAGRGHNSTNKKRGQEWISPDDPAAAAKLAKTLTSSASDQDQDQDQDQLLSSSSPTHDERSNPNTNQGSRVSFAESDTVISASSTSSASSAPEAQSSSLSSSLDPKVSEPQKQSLSSASSDQNKSPSLSSSASSAPKAPKDQLLSPTSPTHDERSNPDAGDGPRVNHSQSPSSAPSASSHLIFPDEKNERLTKKDNTKPQDDSVVTKQVKTSTPPTHDDDVPSEMNSSILVAEQAKVDSQMNSPFPVAMPAELPRSVRVSQSTPSRVRLAARQREAVPDPFAVGLAGSQSHDVPPVARPVQLSRSDRVPDDGDRDGHGHSTQSDDPFDPFDPFDPARQPYVSPGSGVDAGPGHGHGPGPGHGHVPPGSGVDAGHGHGPGHGDGHGHDDGPPNALIDYYIYYNQYPIDNPDLEGLSHRLSFFHLLCLQYSNQYDDVAKTLCEYGKDNQIVKQYLNDNFDNNYIYENAIHFASFTGKHEIIDEFSKINRDNIPTHPRNPYHYAKNDRVIKSLLNKDYKGISDYDDFHCTPLHYAAYMNYYQVVDEILKNEVSENLNIVTGVGTYLYRNRNDLRLRYRNELREIYFMLIGLERGSNIEDITNISNLYHCYSSAVHLAVMSNGMTNEVNETLRVLTKDARVNVNCLDYMGMTPLSWACACGNYDAVKILLESGANPDGLDFHRMLELESQGNNNLYQNFITQPSNLNNYVTSNYRISQNLDNQNIRYRRSQYISTVNNDNLNNYNVYITNAIVKTPLWCVVNYYNSEYERDYNFEDKQKQDTKWSSYYQIARLLIHYNASLDHKHLYNYDYCLRYGANSVYVIKSPYYLLEQRMYEHGNNSEWRRLWRLFMSHNLRFDDDTNMRTDIFKYYNQNVKEYNAYHEYVNTVDIRVPKKIEPDKYEKVIESLYEMPFLFHIEHINIRVPNNPPILDIPYNLHELLIKLYKLKDKYKKKIRKNKLKKWLNIVEFFNAYISNVDLYASENERHIIFKMIINIMNYIHFTGPPGNDPNPYPGLLESVQNVVVVHRRPIQLINNMVNPNYFLNPRIYLSPQRNFFQRIGNGQVINVNDESRVQYLQEMNNGLELSENDKNNSKKWKEILHWWMQEISTIPMGDIQFNKVRYETALLCFMANLMRLDYKLYHIVEGDIGGNKRMRIPIQSRINEKKYIDVDSKRFEYDTNWSGRTDNDISVPFTNKRFGFQFRKGNRYNGFDEEFYKPTNRLVMSVMGRMKSEDKHEQRGGGPISGRVEISKDLEKKRRCLDMYIQMQGNTELDVDIMLSLLSSAHPSQLRDYNERGEWYRHNTRIFEIIHEQTILRSHEDDGNVGNLGTTQERVYDNMKLEMGLNEVVKRMMNNKNMLRFLGLFLYSEYNKFKNRTYKDDDSSETYSVHLCDARKYLKNYIDDSNIPIPDIYKFDVIVSEHGENVERIKRREYDSSKFMLDMNVDSAKYDDYTINSESKAFDDLYKDVMVDGHKYYGRSEPTHVQCTRLIVRMLDVMTDGDMRLRLSELWGETDGDKRELLQDLMLWYYGTKQYDENDMNMTTVIAGADRFMRGGVIEFLGYFLWQQKQNVLRMRKLLRDTAFEKKIKPRIITRQEIERIKGRIGVLELNLRGLKSKQNRVELDLSNFEEEFERDCKRIERSKMNKVRCDELVRKIREKKTEKTELERKISRLRGELIQEKNKLEEATLEYKRGEMYRKIEAGEIDEKTDAGDIEREALEQKREEVELGNKISEREEVEGEILENLKKIEDRERAISKLERDLSDPSLSDADRVRLETELLKEKEKLLGLKERDGKLREKSQELSEEIKELDGIVSKHSGNKDELKREREKREERKKGKELDRLTDEQRKELEKHLKVNKCMDRQYYEYKELDAIMRELEDTKTSDERKAQLVNKANGLGLSTERIIGEMNNLLSGNMSSIMFPDSTLVDGNKGRVRDDYTEEGKMLFDKKELETRLNSIDETLKVLKERGFKGPGESKPEKPEKPGPGESEPVKPGPDDRPGPGQDDTDRKSSIGEPDIVPLLFFMDDDDASVVRGGTRRAYGGAHGGNRPRTMRRSRRGGELGMQLGGREMRRGMMRVTGGGLRRYEMRGGRIMRIEQSGGLGGIERESIKSKGELIREIESRLEKLKKIPERGEDSEVASKIGSYDGPTVMGAAFRRRYLELLELLRFTMQVDMHTKEPGYLVDWYNTLEWLTYMAMVRFDMMDEDKMSKNSMRLSELSKLSKNVQSGGLREVDDDLEMNIRIKKVLEGLETEIINSELLRDKVSRARYAYENEGVSTGILGGWYRRMPISNVVQFGGYVGLRGIKSTLGI